MRIQYYRGGTRKEIERERKKSDFPTSFVLQQKRERTEERIMLFIWTSNNGNGPIFGLLMLALQLILPTLIQRPDYVFPMKLLILALGIVYYLWRQSNDEVRNTFLSLRHRTQGMLSRHSGLQWTPFWTSICIGSVVGLSVVIVLLLDITVIASFIQAIAIGIAFYNFNNDGADGRHQRRGGPADDGQDQQEDVSEEVKLEQLVATVQTMPIESFVNEQDMMKLPSSELKQMLQRRGLTTNELRSFIDRQNILETLQSIRRFSDTCCICFETYQKGDPLRILPNCGHELHLECLDQWAYTFATSSKRRYAPTCPLCKEKM